MIALKPTRAAKLAVSVTAVIFLATCNTGLRTKWKLPNIDKLNFTSWKELRSENFALYSRASSESLQAFANDIDHFVAVTEKVTNQSAVRSAPRIFLLDGLAEDLFFGSQYETGAFITRSLSGFDGVVRGNDHRPYTRSILLHEFVHYITFRGTAIDIPVWYSEGMADFLATTRLRGDVMEIGPPFHMRLESLNRRRAMESPIQLDEIFSYRKTGSSDYPSDFYPISWAIVHYLIANGENVRLKKMIALQRSGKSWEESFDVAFDVSPEELAEEVDAHAKSIAHGAPGTVALIPVEDLEIRHSSQIRELTEAEAAFYLGEIAMRGVSLSRSETQSGRLAEAILLKAHEFDPTEPRIEAALALCLAQQRRFQEAQNHLDALPPMKDLDVESLLFAARAMQLKSTSRGKSSKTDEQWTKQNELARRLFQEAIQKNRDSPHAYAGLGRAQFAAGELDRARDSMAKARSLGEWDAELTLEQGRLAEKMAKKDLARAFWSEVIELGADAEAKQAAALISRLDADPVESDSTEDERMDEALGQYEPD